MKLTTEDLFGELFLVINGESKIPNPSLSLSSKFLLSDLSGHFEGTALSSKFLPSNLSGHFESKARHYDRCCVRSHAHTADTQAVEAVLGCENSGP